MEIWICVLLVPGTLILGYLANGYFGSAGKKIYERHEPFWIRHVFKTKQNPADKWDTSIVPDLLLHPQKIVYDAPPKEMQVERKFNPAKFTDRQCTWANQFRLGDYEQKQYEFFVHPQYGARCYRKPSPTTDPDFREYLMMDPFS